MKKTVLIFIGVVAGAIALVLFAKSNHIFFGENMLPYAEPPIGTPSDPKNISYVVNGEKVAFTNGKFEREAAPGSALKESFSFFGEPVLGDLDADGDMDAVGYIVNEGGGSGVFFYVVVAVNENGTYKGTDAMFLGDRIAPQNINILEGRAVANFAERKAGEPFTTPPSQGKSVWVHFDAKTFSIGEWVKDFEGEADPARMTLGMKEWGWVRTEYVDGTKVSPKKPDIFSVAFKNDGSLSVKTDCNSIGGTYVVEKNALTFGPMMSTLMFCEGSQEGEFSAMLGGVSSFTFTGKGELVLGIKDNKGKIILR